MVTRYSCQKFLLCEKKPYRCAAHYIIAHEFVEDKNPWRWTVFRSWEVPVFRYHWRKSRLGRLGWLLM
ncbi:predicted protein [Botrytis cinerea T4]|uniref:Uncharacterized protein n=1 Tax=Botryotinia fuckeliana (strain T4) TaxID=999810 RepID=G2XPT7_BOTF4|nr:predicted protein [Botrytis cinerea T4]